jgi:hypothetical protein
VRLGPTALPRHDVAEDHVVAPAEVDGKTSGLADRELLDLAHHRDALAALVGATVGAGLATSGATM